jgi:hypothetical protein
MVEIRRTTGKSDEQRIADRLKPSNEMASATTHVQQGTGPTRTHHTVHHGSSQKLHTDHSSKSLTDIPVMPGAGAPIVGEKKGSGNV